MLNKGLCFSTVILHKNKEKSSFFTSEIYFPCFCSALVYSQNLTNKSKTVEGGAILEKPSIVGIHYMLMYMFSTDEVICYFNGG